MTDRTFPIDRPETNDSSFVNDRVVTLTEEQLVDFVFDAVSDGPHFHYVSVPKVRGVEGTIGELDYDGNIEETHNYTLDMIETAIGTFVKMRNEHDPALTVNDFMLQYDASDADCVVQLAILGEIRYS